MSLCSSNCCSSRSDHLPLQPVASSTRYKSPAQISILSSRPLYASTAWPYPLDSSEILQKENVQTAPILFLSHLPISLCESHLMVPLPYPWPPPLTHDLHPRYLEINLFEFQQLPISPDVGLILCLDYYLLAFPACPPHSPDPFNVPCYQGSFFTVKLTSHRRQTTLQGLPELSRFRPKSMLQPQGPARWSHLISSLLLPSKRLLLLSRQITQESSKIHVFMYWQVQAAASLWPPSCSSLDFNSRFLPPHRLCCL